MPWAPGLSPSPLRAPTSCDWLNETFSPSDYSPPPPRRKPVTREKKAKGQRSGQSGEVETGVFIIIICEFRIQQLILLSFHRYNNKKIRSWTHSELLAKFSSHNLHHPFLIPIPRDPKTWLGSQAVTGRQWAQVPSFWYSSYSTGSLSPHKSIKRSRSARRDLACSWLLPTHTHLMHGLNAHPRSFDSLSLLEKLNYLIPEWRRREERRGTPFWIYHPRQPEEWRGRVKEHKLKNSDPCEWSQRNEIS